ETAPVGPLATAAGAKETVQTAVDNTASRGSAKGTKERDSAENLALEGVTKKSNLNGAEEFDYPEGAKVINEVVITSTGYAQVGNRAEKSVVDVVFSPIVPDMMADAPRSETEASLEELGVGRGMETLTEKGATISEAAASKVAVMGWCIKDTRPENVPFRFRKIWLEHNQFMPMVKQSWSEPMCDGPIRLVMRKLKRLKQEQESFESQQHLEEMETEKIISNLMQLEATMWKQRACIKEELEGDRNSAYFQAKARIRQSKYFIVEIKTAEGTILHDQGLIKEYMVQAYKKQVYAIPVSRNQEILNLIPHERVMGFGSSKYASCNLEDAKFSEIQRLQLQCRTYKEPGKEGHSNYWASDQESHVQHCC
ncbi:hypothetical protein IFM89_026644, partial [Coptis chinensis]